MDFRDCTQEMVFVSRLFVSFLTQVCTSLKESVLKFLLTYPYARFEFFFFCLTEMIFIYLQMTFLTYLAVCSSLSSSPSSSDSRNPSGSATAPYPDLGNSRLIRHLPLSDVFKVCFVEFLPPEPFFLFFAKTHHLKNP